MYNFVHNFNKYIVSYFNEILSMDSKSDTINKFYKDLLKSKRLKRRNKETNKNNKCTETCIIVL